MQQNDATNPQPNGRRWPVVVHAAAAADHPAAMSDNSGATKTATKTNRGQWQQGNDTGGYDDRGNDRPNSSHTNKEDNNATTGDNQCDRIAADNDSGDPNASTLSVVLTASKPSKHNDDSSNSDADAEDAGGKKTLVSDATAAGNDGGNADAGTLSIVLAGRWWWWWQRRWPWRWQWRWRWRWRWQ